MPLLPYFAALVRFNILNQVRKHFKSSKIPKSPFGKKMKIVLLVLIPNILSFGRSRFESVDDLPYLKDKSAYDLKPVFNLMKLKSKLRNRQIANCEYVSQDASVINCDGIMYTPGMSLFKRI